MSGRSSPRPARQPPARRTEICGVRKDNPCADIDPPDRGEHKQKQWLYPSEFLTLVVCEKVPLRWRQLYALLTYTYLRANELTVLEWSDVDLDAGTIHVTKAWDERAEKVAPPKSSAGVRYVPIEPTLMPLLEALHDASGGQGRVVPVMPPMCEWAKSLRMHLRRAEVKRAALFENSATVKWITLHDLRSTGITWRAADDPQLGSPEPCNFPEARNDSGNLATPAGIEPALPA